MKYVVRFAGKLYRPFDFPEDAFDWYESKNVGDESYVVEKMYSPRKSDES